MLILILQTTGITTLIAGILALILVIADRYFADYGECTIEINGKRKETVKGGSSLLSSLNSKQIYLASACGGRGSCGLCKCKVISGGGPLLPTEKPFLTKQEIADNIRLSCQVKVKENIQIEIPEEIFNIRKFKAKVEKIEDHTYDIKELTLKLISPAKIDFQAGQYVQLHSKKYGKVKQSVSRAYSIASSPSNDDFIQLIIRKVPDGICTTWVHDWLKEGEEVEFTGPFGDFVIQDTKADMLFIAGGSGKAPIKSMVQWLHEHNSDRRMVYFFGARAVKDLYLTEYFEKFEKMLPDFSYVPVLSQPEENDKWEGRTGYITKYLHEFVKDCENSEAYLCGSPAMLNAMVKGLVKCGVKEENIFYDSFG